MGYRLGLMGLGLGREWLLGLYRDKGWGVGLELNFGLGSRVY